MNQLNLIIIIIVLTILILLIILLASSITGHKQKGSSYRIGTDLNNENLVQALNYKNKYYQPIIDKMNILDNKHNEYIKYVCDYITNTESEIDREYKYIIVGDVHGSILQLFMPLKQAQIIDSIEYNNTTKTFKYSINKQLQNNITKVIYCGDFVARAKHSLTVEMLITFLDIYNEVNLINPDLIIWTYGNHDIGFIKYYAFNFDSCTPQIYNSEFSSIDLNPKKDELIEKLRNNVVNNKYPCMYYNSELQIQVSHTFIPLNTFELSIDNDIVNIDYMPGLSDIYYTFSKYIPQFEKLFNYNVEILKNENDEDIDEILKNNIIKEHNKLLLELYNKFNLNTVKNLNNIYDYNNGKLNNSIPRLLMSKISNKLLINIPYTTPEPNYKIEIEPNMTANEEFINLNTEEQIKFINNFAKYIIINSELTVKSIFENIFYWIRPYEIENDNYYQIPNTKYFVGHTVMDLDTIISDNKSDKLNKLFNFLNINSLKDINEYHIKYLKDVYNFNNNEFNNINDINYSLEPQFKRNLMEFNKINNINNELLKSNIIAASAINDLSELYKDWNDMAKEYYKKYYNFNNNNIMDNINNNIFFTDIGATYESPLVKKLENKLINVHNMINDYDIGISNRQYFEKINTYEIGYYRCAFLYCDEINLINNSKMYIF